MPFVGASMEITTATSSRIFLQASNSQKQQYEVFYKAGAPQTWPVLARDAKPTTGTTQQHCIHSSSTSKHFSNTALTSL
jgi:hypothetical protein